MGKKDKKKVKRYKKNQISKKRSKSGQTKKKDSEPAEKRTPTKQVSTLRLTALQREFF